MTGLEYLKGAMRAILAIGSGGTPTANEQTDGFEILLSLLRSYGADNFFKPGTVVEYYTLSAGTAQYSIGSGESFDTDTWGTVAPHRITKAYIKSNSIDYPIELIDEGKYAMIPDKTDQSSFPSMLWYDQAYDTFATSYIYVWPTGAGTIYLHQEKPFLEPATINAEVVVPLQYEEFIKYELAIRLAPEFGRPIPPEVVGLAEAAKHRVTVLNASQKTITMAAPEYGDKTFYNRNSILSF